MVNYFGSFAISWLQPKKEGEDEKQGEIKHTFRDFVFIFSRKHAENGGIFVCKARHLLLVGGNSGGGTRSKFPLSFVMLIDMCNI